VLVAVTVFGVASTGLAAMTFWVGTRARTASGASQRAAILARSGESLAAVAFDSLAARSGCEEAEAGTQSFLRCVRVDDLSYDARRVIITVTPRATYLTPDTLVFERTRSRPYNPLQ